jgi:peptidoglycan biosynthesis protein MviN/MurJ (putative lipid II flippase)
MGALLPFVIVRWFGLGRASDAYFLVAGTATLAGNLAALVIESSSLPYASQATSRGGDAERTTAARLTKYACIVAAPFTVGFVLLVMLLLLPTAHFDATQISESRRLLAILIPFPVLNGMCGVYTAAHYARGVFGRTAATQATRALGALIFGATLGPAFGVSAIALGLTLGEAARWLILRSAMPRPAGHRQCARDVEAGIALPAFLRVASPVMAATMLVAANPLVDKAVATHLQVGSTSVIELAEKLFYIPTILFIRAVSIVSGTAWSRLLDRNDRRLARDYWRVQEGAALMTCGVAGAATLAVFAGQNWAKGVLHIPAGTPLAPVFLVYIVGLPFAMSADLGARLVMVKQRTSMMPILSVVLVAVNVVADVVAAKHYGIVGIAISSTIVRMVNCLGFVVASALVLATTSPMSLPKRRIRGTLAISALAVALAASVAVSPVAVPALVVVVAATCILVVVPLGWLWTLALVVFALVPVHWLPGPRLILTLSPQVLIVAVLGVRSLFSRRGARMHLRSTAWLLASFTIWLIVATLSSSHRSLAAGWLVSFLMLAILPAVIGRADPSARGRIENAWVGLAAILGLFALIETFVLHANPILGHVFANSPATFQLTNFSVYRATTTLGHPVNNGMFFAIAVPRRSGVSLLAMGLSMGGLVASGTRAAFVGGITAALVTLLGPGAPGVSRRHGARILATIVVAVACIPGILYFEARNMSQEDGDSAAFRSAEIPIAVQAIRDSPVLGVGPGAASLTWEPDLVRAGGAGAFESLWLELAVGAGVPALTFGIVLLAAGVVVPLRTRSAPVAGAVLAFVITGSAFNFLEGGRPELLTLGFVLAMAFCPLPSSQPALGRSMGSARALDAGTDTISIQSRATEAVRQ